MATRIPAHLLETFLRQRAAQAQASTAQPTFASTFGGGPYQRTVPISTLFGQPQQQRPFSAFTPGTSTGMPSYYNGTATNPNPFFHPGLGFRPPPTPPPPSGKFSYGRNGERFNPSLGGPIPQWFMNPTGTNTNTGWGSTNLGAGVGINNTNTNTNTNASEFGGNPSLQRYWNSNLPTNIANLPDGPTTVGAAFTSYLSELRKDAHTTANNAQGWQLREQALRRVIAVDQVEGDWREGKVGSGEAETISRRFGSTFLSRDRDTNAVTWSTWDNYLVSKTQQRSTLNPFLRRNEGLDQPQPQFQPQGTSFFGAPAGNTSYNPFTRTFGASTPFSGFSSFSL